MKAAVSFKWGKRTECKRHLEAKKVQKKNIPQPQTKTHG